MGYVDPSVWKNAEELAFCLSYHCLNSVWGLNLPSAFVHVRHSPQFPFICLEVREDEQLVARGYLLFPVLTVRKPDTVCCVQFEVVVMKMIRDDRDRFFRWSQSWKSYFWRKDECFCHSPTRRVRVTTCVTYSWGSFCAVLSAFTCCLHQEVYKSS